MNLEHEGVEVDTRLLDVRTLNGVEEKVHQVGLAATWTAPDVYALRGRVGADVRGSGCVVDDRVVRSRVLHRLRLRRGSRRSPLEPAPPRRFGLGSRGRGRSRCAVRKVGLAHSAGVFLVVVEEVVVYSLQDFRHFSLHIMHSSPSAPDTRRR